MRFLVKLSIGVFGIIMLVALGSIDLSAFRGLVLRSDLLALAFVAILLTVPVASWRWCLIMRGLGFKVRLGWSVNVTFISQFFNTFLPGAYGGDVVRLALAYRATGEGLHRLIFSVVIDRLTGLLALIILGILMIPFLPVSYGDRLVWLALVLTVTCFASLTLIIISGEKIVSLIARLPPPFGPFLKRVGEDVMAALRSSLEAPSVLILAVAISLAQYVLVLGALFVLGQAMLFTGLSVSGYVVAGVWGLISNALPITPGGLGIGEAAFDHVASIFADSPASNVGFGAAFLAMRMCSICVGLLGVIPLLVSNADVKGSVSLLHGSQDSKEGASLR